MEYYYTILSYWVSAYFQGRTVGPGGGLVDSPTVPVPSAAPLKSPPRRPLARHEDRQVQLSGPRVTGETGDVWGDVSEKLAQKKPSSRGSYAVGDDHIMFGGEGSIVYDLDS